MAIPEMPPSDAATLDALIERYCITSVIEIGSFLGCSAIFFARHPEIHTVTCIDPFYCPPDHWWAEDLKRVGVPLNYRPLFDANVAASGVGHKISALPFYSAFAADHVRPADMVYVDGDHSYEGCSTDIELYWEKATILMAGDDHHYDADGKPYFPGVVQAVVDYLPGAMNDGRIWWKAKVE